MSEVLSWLLLLLAIAGTGALVVLWVILFPTRR